MAEAAGGEASSAGWKWLWTWRSLMPLALLPLGPGPQPGNGCCGGCWMVAETGPASPQQPEAWQPRQRNGEKTDNPRSGCLLRRPPEPWTCRRRRRRVGGRRRGESNSPAFPALAMVTGDSDPLPGAAAAAAASPPRSRSGRCSRRACAGSRSSPRLLPPSLSEAAQKLPG